MSNNEFDIDALASLAMLSVSEEEKEALARDLPSIVSYIGKLHEVDTSSLDAKAYLTDEVNVFRADEIAVNEEERLGIIEGFPKKKGDALEVPAVFE